MRDFEPVTTEPMVADVLALRGFRVSGDGYLVGLHYVQPVVSGVNEAQCPDHRQNHSAPGEEHACGWYAYDEHRWWHGRSYFTQEDVLSDSRPALPGKVSCIVRLSGRIVVCERGLRAQYLEVVAITCSPGDRASVQARYPDAKFYSDEEMMLEEHPLTRLSRGEETETFKKKALRVTREVISSPDFKQAMSTFLRLGMHCAALLFLSFFCVSFFPGPGPDRVIPLVIMLSALFLVNARVRSLFSAILLTASILYAWSGVEDMVVPALLGVGFSEKAILVGLIGLAGLPLTASMVYTLTHRRVPAVNAGGMAGGVAAGPAAGAATGGAVLALSSARVTLPPKVKGDANSDDKMNPHSGDDRKEDDDG